MVKEDASKTRHLQRIALTFGFAMMLSAIIGLQSNMTYAVLQPGVGESAPVPSYSDSQDDIMPSPSPSVSPSDSPLVTTTRSNSETLPRESTSDPVSEHTSTGWTPWIFFYGVMFVIVAAVFIWVFRGGRRRL